MEAGRSHSVDVGIVDIHLHQSQDLSALGQVRT